MVTTHPSELDALQERLNHAERECQRLREIISTLADAAASLNRKVIALQSAVEESWR